MCPKCHDTGIISLEDNDAPCDCPMGDKPKFICTMAGKKREVTGRQLKEEYQAVREAA